MQSNYERSIMQTLFIRQQAFFLASIVALFFFGSALVAYAGPKDCDADATAVPGHCGKDSGTVVGHYYSVYAYDDNGDYYWDLGDGRIYKTVDSIADLEQETLTQCDYIVNYRGDFGDDPFLDAGVIQNKISCSGFDDNNQYMFTIVSDNDPRFTGEKPGPGWGSNWEYHVYTISGEGNVIQPMQHVGS